MNRLLITPLLALAVGGCATTPDDGPSRTHNVITMEEIQEVQALTALDAVQRLRPEFLRRGRVNMREDTRTYPIVYLDDLRLGEVDELRRIRSSEIFRIEYLSGSDATMRFGMGHSGGALIVTTLSAAGYDG